MNRRISRNLFVRAAAAATVLCLVVTATCSEPASAPLVRKAATLAWVTAPPSSATVGASVGTVSVKVTDAQGDAVAGALVTFTITRGGGTLGRPADTSGADGIAATTYRLGTFPTANELTALVSGLAELRLTVTGVVGVPRSVTFAQRALRYAPNEDSLLTTATARDTFNNATGAPIVFVARDTTLVSVVPVSGAPLTTAAVVRARRRPGATWLVASSSAANDSLQVVVNDSSTVPCGFVATPVTAALGAAVLLDNGTACLRADAAEAEFALVAHLNTAAQAVVQSLAVSTEGNSAPSATFPAPAEPVAASASVDTAAPDRNWTFERSMREREGREIAPRVANARAWMSARSAAPRAGVAETNVLPAAPVEGGLVSLNVNAMDFCSRPDARQARIVAITNGAVVMADAQNPVAGFTDDEYRSFGRMMDTLVIPVDTAAFGAPTDIDGNGRVTIFFTRAVNELTPTGSAGGIVLGYYYLRDLLPRTSAFGDCPGSNVGEMFYVLVPDPSGEVNNNVRTKAYVSSVVVSTIAHEYQHLINAARRMYVNDASRVDEEVWLNEGLSHIAEELVFFRAAGAAPRANIGATQLAAGSAMRAAFDTYQRPNLSRYREYLRAPESNSPLAGDDALATRGATWAFLRYVADRVRSVDGDFWRRLVNATTTGTTSIDAALAGTGVTTLDALRDWSVSVLTDDNPAAVAPTYQHASWNFISAYSVLGSLNFALAPRVPSPGATTNLQLAGGASAYLRFGVSSGRDALIRVNPAGSGPLPPGLRFTAVRIK